MKALTKLRVKIIKAAWEPGMSAKEIAAAISPIKWGSKPTRGSIVGMFDRWPNELAPAHLDPKIKIKPKPAPEPESVPELKTTNKNTKNVSNGYVAPPKRSKLPLPAVRDNYGLSDKALRKHLHEERMLERDKANISSPAYRFNPRKSS